MDHPEDDCVTVGAIKLADSLLNPIIGANNLKQKDAEGEEKNFCDEVIKRIIIILFNKKIQEVKQNSLLCRLFLARSRTRSRNGILQ